MKKKILFIAIALGLFSACSKKQTPAPGKVVKIETNLSAPGQSYEVIVTETKHGADVTIIDTTITGGLDYTFTPTTGDNTRIEVISNDSVAKPTIHVLDNNTVEEENTESDISDKFHFLFLFVAI